MRSPREGREAGGHPRGTQRLRTPLFAPSGLVLGGCSGVVLGIELRKGATAASTVRSSVAFTRTEASEASPLRRGQRRHASETTREVGDPWW